MNSLIEKLGGKDRRSIGNANQIVIQVLKTPSLIKKLIEILKINDPILRMRTADVIEKISRSHPDYLNPYKKILLNEGMPIQQQEVRWHMAQILPRLSLKKNERKKAVKQLFQYLEDESKIVKTFAMQGLADFAFEDNELKKKVIFVIEDLIKIGSAAMRARGKKLLIQLKK